MKHAAKDMGIPYEKRNVFFLYIVRVLDGCAIDISKVFAE